MTTKLGLFLSLLRKFYFDRLDRKTGWGNQEVRLEFEQAINEALAQMIEDLQSVAWSVGPERSMMQDEDERL